MKSTWIMLSLPPMARNSSFDNLCHFPHLGVSRADGDMIGGIFVEQRVVKRMPDWEIGELCGTSDFAESRCTFIKLGQFAQNRFTLVGGLHFAQRRRQRSY